MKEKTFNIKDNGGNKMSMPGQSKKKVLYFGRSDVKNVARSLNPTETKTFVLAVKRRINSINNLIRHIDFCL